MAPDLETPPGFETPPGTIRLAGEKGELHEQEIVLSPMPSKDPNDPLNWTTFRKAANFIPVLAITAIIFSQVSISIVLWQLWVVDFNCTYEDLQTGSAIALAGTALGCTMFIPFAIKYGRRIVYIGSLILMTAMAIWQAALTTVTALYICMFFTGLASATNETIVQMTVADIFFVHQRGTGNGLYMTMVMIGSYLSPIIAGYMAQDGNWRQCYWVFAGLEAFMLVYFCFFYEESKYIPTIEATATSSTPTNVEEVLGSKDDSTVADDETEVQTSAPLAISATNLSHIDSSIPLLPWKQRMRLITKTDESLWQLVYEPFIILFSYPHALYTGLQYAFGLCWISALGSVLATVFPYPPYNFNTAAIGLMGLGPFIGSLLGAIYGGLLSDRSITWLARRNHGYYEPEMRLQLSHIPAVAMSVGLILFGISTAQGMHWSVPAVAGGIFGFGVGSITDISLTLLVDSYRAITGEAFIGVAFIRNIFSIAIFFSITPWMEAQGIQNMFIVIGLWALVIAFLHVPLIIWGKKIRVKTSEAYTKLAAGKGDTRI
ncbi:major facilitator superfamily domain-containing protein [Xylariales sp. PMI_506]|nr:major facilitator superfamily domain-containing protein [Xylariales sp. PMI_506]